LSEVYDTVGVARPGIFRRGAPWLLPILAVLLLAAGILLATGYGDKDGGKNSAPAEHRIANSTPTATQFATGTIKKGIKAPDFDIPNIEKGRIKLSNYRGKAVMLDFWSVGCPPCIEATALLQKLYVKYQRKGLMVIGINVDPYPEMVKKFVQRARLTYPIGIANSELIKNYGGLPTIPQSFLVDRNGILAKQYDGFGALSAYQMERDIRRALGIDK